MTNLKADLEGYVASKPRKISGNEIIGLLKGRLLPVIEHKRCELVAVLKDWLLYRSEPLTMYAVELIEQFKLVELHDELEKLLRDIENEDVFAPYYSSWVKKSLNSLA